MRKNNKLFRTLVVSSIIFISVFLIMYLLRWNYRNNEGPIGKVFNSIFNLNTLEVKSNVKNVKIIWKGENRKGQALNYEIYNNNEIDLSGIKNFYGPNGFDVYLNGQIKSFSFMKTSWSQTFDYKFIINDDSVVFIKGLDTIVR